MKEKIKVFLCDDHTLFREGVKAIFRNHPGIQVIGEAENGREGVAGVRKTHPDVVLMDVSMPVMNGFEATRIIARSVKATKVLMLTMYDEDDLIMGCLEAGAYGYVLKDAPSSQLIHAVEETYKGRQFLSSGVASKTVQEYLRTRKHREVSSQVA